MIIEFLILLAILLFIYHHYAFSYWKRRNVFSVPGEFLFGSIKTMIFNRETLCEFLQRIYKENKTHKLVGFYSLYQPMLIVNDQELIQAVLVKDFNKFCDNGFTVDIKVDAMFGANPFVTKGLQNWKNVRGILQPVLTPMKLKEYIPCIASVGKNMVEYLKAKNSEPVMIKELTSYYTIDNVASCFYGCDPTAFTDSENGFVKHASVQLFNPSILANLSSLFFPKVAQLFKMRIVSQETQDFFVSMVKSAKDFRVKHNVYRSDLIDQLTKINKRLLEEKKTGFTDLEIAGHSFTFYLDGFESSANELCFLLLELANSPEVQEKLREEIFTAGKEFEDFDYEKVKSMTYLSMVLTEAMRLNPVVPILSRVCTEEVQLGKTVVEKGTKIFVPVVCIQRDPDIYPDPDAFKPERFAGENKESSMKCTLLSFGEGPRKCLGFKFAELQLKLALIYILMNFKVLPSSENGKEEIVYEKSSPFVVNPKNGTQLRFESL